MARLNRPPLHVHAHVAHEDSGCTESAPGGICSSVVVVPADGSVEAHEGQRRAGEGGGRHQSASKQGLLRQGDPIFLKGQYSPVYELLLLSLEHCF